MTSTSHLYPPGCETVDSYCLYHLPKELWDSTHTVTAETLVKHPMNSESDFPSVLVHWKFS